MPHVTAFRTSWHPLIPSRGSEDAASLQSIRNRVRRPGPQLPGRVLLHGSFTVLNLLFRLSHKIMLAVATGRHASVNCRRLFKTTQQYEPKMLFFRPVGFSRRADTAPETLCPR